MAESDREVRARHEANRASWNETARRDYTRELEESIAFLREGRSNLHPVELVNLGDLRAWCCTAIHLQCSSGEDTLSLWNEGVAKVVGIDISDVHIANARFKSEALGAPAEWYRCDVLDAPRELNGTADLVYTGRGVLCWLHDLDGWASVVFRLLKPGGILHLLDDHPITWLFEPDAETYEWSGIDYFSHAQSNEGLSPIYHERLWTLADVSGAVRHAGLMVEHLGEHREGYWERFPNLRSGLEGKVPLTFSMVARRP